MHADPRAASSTILGGPPDLAGDEILRLEPVTLNGEQIAVPAALPGAPEYRTVFRAEQAADRLLTEIAENLDTRGQIPTADVRLALDFRDVAGTAVASAAVGLEGFANFHLQRLVTPDEEVTLSDGEAYTLDQLRNMRLNDRYRLVLPNLMDRPRPTSEDWWRDFRRIQSLSALQRHAITEPHSRKGLDGERSLAQRIYGAEYRGAAPAMLSAFEHFAPGWINQQRRQALSADP
jgi:hypothetical protein